MLVTLWICLRVIWAAGVLQFRYGGLDDRMLCQLHWRYLKPQEQCHHGLLKVSCQVVSEQSQVFDICMDLQAWAVHQIKQGGRTQGVLSETQEAC